MRQLSRYTIADITYLLILAVVSLSFFGTHGIVLFLSLGIAYIIPSCILHRSTISSAVANVSLLSVGVIMSTLIMLNYHYYSYSMGTIDAPYLTNTDMHKYWNMGVAICNGVEITRLANLGYAGFPVLVSSLFKAFGIDIIYPMAMNMFCILMSIVCTGFTVKSLLKDDRWRIVSGYAIAISCAVCYYIYLGTVILKDAPICLGMSLSVLAIVKIMRQGITVSRIVLMIIGFMLLMFTRTPMLCFLVILVLLLVRIGKRVTILNGIIIILSVVICLSIGFLHASHTAAEVADMVDNVNTNSYFDSESAQSPYLSIIGDYVGKSVGYKLLLLPLSMVVQMFIPLPFDFTHYIDMGISLVYAKVAYPWYAIVGLYMYYYLFLCYRKKFNNGVITRLALFALGAFALLAYMFAGTVSRYFMPFVPLVSIVGAYALCQIVQNKELRRMFIIYSSIYVVAIVATMLVVVYVYNR